jgi:photosystem II stability/assembly factor-like uncharacterized protein
MTPEEKELRRALDARSGDPSPAFRSRLLAALDEGKPASNLWPALAAVAAVVLVVATIGVLLLARQARTVAPPVTAASTPTPVAIPGVLTKPPGPIPLPSTAELSAPSATVVWTVVDDRYLYRSTDRGATWEQRPVPPSQLPLPEVSFVSDTEGWLNTGGSQGCNSEAVSIWHTTDAGTTWQKLGSMGVSDVMCKQGLSFVDSKRGFLDSWDNSHATVIYRTADGGQTWTASQPLAAPTSTAGYFNFEPGLVRAFGSTLLVTAGWAHSVYRSLDGGATWTYAAAAKVQYSNVDFVTVSRWLQLIAPGQSVETTNAGASWHISGSQYSQAAPVAADFVFADSQVGYGTVRGGITRTEDGGLHWAAIETPGTGMKACC